MTIECSDCENNLRKVFPPKKVFWEKQRKVHTRCQIAIYAIYVPYKIMISTSLDQNLRASMMSEFFFTGKFLRYETSIHT